MTWHVQQPGQRTDRVATRPLAAAVARWQVVLQRRQQEAVVTARAVCRRSQLALDVNLGDGFAEHLRIRPLT